MPRPLRICPPHETIRIILLSTGPLAIHLINHLQTDPSLAEVVGVLPLSKVPKFEFLADHPFERDLLQLAEEQGLNLIDCPGANSPEFLNIAANLKPHLILVGNWSEILRPAVIGLDGVHIINCHDSLLPKYRGASPSMAAIFNGDTETGLTFHLIDQGIDTGDILFQQTVPILADDTAVSLRDRISQQFGQNIVPLLRRIMSGNVYPQPQTGPTSYVPAQSPEWGWIPWTSRPQVIDQRMRAVVGFLPLATSINGDVIGFESGAVVSSSDYREQTAAFLERFHPSRLANPGTVVANLPDKIIVTTVRPTHYVKLDKPVIQPISQSATADPIDIGSHFYSMACGSILKSA